MRREKKFHVWVVNEEALIPPLLQAESAAWYLFSFVYGSSYIMFLFVLFLGHIINSNVTCLHRWQKKELSARTCWHQRKKIKKSSEKEHGHQRKSQSFRKKTESVFWQLFCIDIETRDGFLFFSKQPIAEKRQKKSPQELQQWWLCPGFVATFPKTWQILAKQKSGWKKNAIEEWREREWRG